jgi:Thrombospondin type 3 repeat
VEWRVVKLVALVAMSLALSCGYGASFSDCTISCSSATGCPGGFACGPEGLCRTANVTESCAAQGREDANSGLPLDTTVSSDGSNGSGCPGDLDCDGVPDGSDNCPTVANPDQANEDGDRFGDVCDPCPPYADSDPIADQDGDGVSDACDPRPTIPGDVISLFEGFHHGLPSGWIVAGSSWGAGGSDDVIVTGDTGVSSLTFASTWTTTQHESVLAAITPATFGANDAMNVGVVDDYLHGSPDSGIACALTSGFDVTVKQFVALDSISAGAQTFLSEPAYTFNIGQPQVVSLRRDTTMYGCAATSASGSADGSGSSSVDETPPEIGVRLVDQAAVARIQWVMVVGNQ